MIDRFELLLALAKERHFGRAAESCGVTQPTLSAGLKQLEEQLGVRLVERGSRFIGFTPEGERALQWARRVIGDVRAMRQEIAGMRKGLSGHLRIAGIPTAMPMLSELTTPFHEKHGDVRFTLMSASSNEVLRLIENLEADAGVTYLDNDPLGRVKTVPLYQEGYRFLTAVDAPLGDRAKVTWEEIGQVPLCLLTPDMQNRRIVDKQLTEAGHAVVPMLEANSTLALLSHVRTGKWASVVANTLADVFAFPENIRSIPIEGPEVLHQMGLVVLDREPLTPIVTALMAEARAIAPELAARM
ncbi:transcriptional regulator, LysR family [Ancylobacter novellus DSM 506]|uniref:Transcriptional regulator, LysR family n=1 Tax=Ancylobacter novellus (strain ATCC 8093 / DSM 506 / JCM 20403 / CCM 1077 / IAM 12100 / NBRC 12443 / NCIMB 10456) TaxID=639283 RepID=D6ZZX8_ANCN5|nr:LysR family transcriptional regulator [Ancylobacter novellus]ADH87392.1 transcriptional regulator, LysR family [Ancylobacter novellus DSM 506]